MIENSHTHTYSLQQECGESVCGVQLTDVNLQISNTLPLLVASFSTADSYLSLLARGQCVCPLHRSVLVVTCG